MNPKEKAQKKGKSHGYHVRKSGDASVVLLGFPSVGKSTLLNSLCGTDSPVASYAFTTLTVIPGTIKHKHATIQILDVPGIVYGAASGKGRGREVLGVIRSADMVLIVIDALNPQQYKAILREVRNSGIRLNRLPPHITIKKKAKGGIDIGSRVKLTNITKETMKAICREFRINNADILVKENIDVDGLIDAIEGNKSYIPGITVINKSDLISESESEQIKKELKPDLFISAHNNINIEKLKDLIYDRLRFMSVFLKEIGKKPDLEEPLIMRTGCTIGDVCKKLHKDFFKKFRYARLWGPSAKFDGQMFKKMTKKLKEGDIIEIHLN